MELEIYDTITKVSNISVRERNKLKNLMSAKPEGYVHMPAYKRGTWDGNISLYKNAQFPTGLLHLLEPEFEHVVKTDHRQPIVTQSGKIPNYEFRDYQIEAIAKALKHGSGVLKMATNAGKTLIMASIIKAIGSKAIVIVPNRTLLLQTANDLESMLGIEVGRIGATYHNKGSVTVSTIASLPKLLDHNLDDNVAVFVDECHHTGAATLFDNIFSIPGRIRIAMSGTPLTKRKLRDLKLIAVAGDVIYEISNKELIEASYSLQPVIRFSKIEQPDRWEAKYSKAYDACIIDNESRNTNSVEIANREKHRGPVLIVCSRIRHVSILHDSLGSFYATGQLSVSEINSVLSEFAESKDGILVCTPIFGEGVNIPDISTIILAAGGKSHIQLLQRIGRGLRTGGIGDDKLHVYDFLDFTNKYLMKHSEIRYKLYKEEGFTVELLT